MTARLTGRRVLGSVVVRTLSSVVAQVESDLQRGCGLVVVGAVLTGCPVGGIHLVHGSVAVLAAFWLGAAEPDPTVAHSHRVTMIDACQRRGQSGVMLNTCGTAEARDPWANTKRRSGDGLRRPHYGSEG